MSHNTHEGIINLSHVSSISLALLFFYFIIQIRVAPYPSRILSALAQLQADLTGLKRVKLGRGSPTI